MLPTLCFRSLSLALALVITQFSVLAFTVNFQVVHAGCGNANGSITLSPNGGTSPYNFTWVTPPPNGQGTPLATGLAPGTYTIDVTDATATMVTLNIDVLSLPGLNMTAALNSAVVHAACPGMCTGGIALNTNMLGGQGPFTITTNPPMPLDMLCGGTAFDISVTDALGCTGTITTMVPEVDYPVLLGTVLNGPCPGAPTSVEAFFSPSLNNSFDIAGPGGAPGYANIGPHGGYQISFPQPYGIYAFNYWTPPACPNQNYLITFPGTLADCSDLDGILYVDVNGNCIQDIGDFPLTHKLVTVNPGGYSALTDMLGHYQLQLPYGTYDLTYADPVYSQSCPVASPVNFTLDVGTPTATIDLPFTPGPDPDVAISCVFGQAVPGFQQHLWVTVTNNGAVPSGPITITVDHDPLLTNCFSWWCLAPPFNQPVVVPYPTSFLPGQLIWDLPEGLEPGVIRSLTAQLCVPPDPTLLGTNFNYTATATTTLTDADLTNNTCTHIETVVGSFDPNDKTARTTSGSSSEWSLENDSLITYTIRFQNTGTAPAVNVVVTDSISGTLDLSTLKILGASHTMVPTLNDRVLTFTFDHILLPDSNANEAGSHGFAQFSIAPNTMSSGSSVSNEADIFFDFNPPIRTNTSVVEAPLNTSVASSEIREIGVFPNPVGEHLSLINTSGKRYTASIFNSDGRLIQTNSQVTTQINVGALAPGTYVLILSNESENKQLRFVKQ